jgi:LysM repeat protein
MKKLFFIITLIFCAIIVYSQHNQTSIFTNGDKLYINLGIDSELYYTHTVEKGHTIYSLSKAYNVTSTKLYSYNDMQEDSPIPLGQNLKIPLQDRQLYKGINLDQIKKGHYIPVYYKTQPKDNIFRISRVYFNQSTDDLMRRNNLKDNILGLGQDILVGWLPIDGKISNIEEVESEFGEEQLDQEVATDNATELEIDSNLLETEAQEENIDSIQLQYPSDFNPTLLGDHTYNNNMKIIKKTDVAFWDKTILDNGTVFALHESALIDSYINVFNTNTRRSVRIKVIGRIPYGTYTNDVKLLISPRAAKQLGGLDRRFKVEVSYIAE